MKGVKFISWVFKPNINYDIIELEDIIQDEIENGEVVGDKKKYIQALFNLNNKLVEKYNSKGGDATGYYLEWADNKPDSVAIAGLI